MYSPNYGTPADGGITSRLTLVAHCPAAAEFGLAIMTFRPIHIILIALLGLSSCVTMSADPRLVGTYVATDSEALIFEPDTGVYHCQLSDGKKQRVFLGFASANSSSPPGSLSIAGPDTSPFIGTSFQVSEDFSIVTVHWVSFTSQTHTPHQTQFRKGSNPEP